MSYDSVILGTPGLVSYWKLDELSGTTAIDSFGSHPGTYSGFTLGEASVTLQLGSSIASSGGGLVIVPAFELGTTISLEFWLHMSPGTQGNLTAYIARPPLADNWYVMTFGGVLYCNVQGSGIFSYTLPGGFDADWHHIVWTQTGTSAILYIDNVAVTTGTNTVLPTGHDTVGTNDLCFGSGNGQWPMQGLIDAISLYNTVLDAPTVAAHYTEAFATVPLVDNASMLLFF